MPSCLSSLVSWWNSCVSRKTTVQPILITPPVLPPPPYSPQTMGPNFISTNSLSRVLANPSTSDAVRLQNLIDQRTETILHIQDIKQLVQNETMTLSPEEQQRVEQLEMMELEHELLQMQTVLQLHQLKLAKLKHGHQTQQIEERIRQLQFKQQEQQSKRTKTSMSTQNPLSVNNSNNNPLSVNNMSSPSNQNNNPIGTPPSSIPASPLHMPSSNSSCPSIVVVEDMSLSASVSAGTVVNTPPTSSPQTEIRSILDAPIDPIPSNNQLLLQGSPTTTLSTQVVFRPSSRATSTAPSTPDALTNSNSSTSQNIRLGIKSVQKHNVVPVSPARRMSLQNWFLQAPPGT